MRSIGVHGVVCRSFAARIAAVAGTLAVGAAQAQPAGPGGINFWINPNSGPWFDSLAWGGVLPSQGGVPDAQTTASITGNTPYQIDLLNSGGDCHHLFINNPLATLLIAGVNPGSPASLTVHGAQWDSTGTVRLGLPGSQSDSTIRINNNITVAGGGTIRLDAQTRPFGATIASQFNQGFLMINGAGHTISGEGRISVRLRNNGAVRADVPSRAIVLDSAFLTENNGTVSASGGGILQLNANGGVLQGAGGVFGAGNGSELQIVGVGASGFTGGTISTSGTGRVLVATQGALMDDFTLTGGSLMTFSGNSGVNFGPQGVRNFGTINSGPNGFVTSVFGQGTTLSGTGRLQLEGGELGRFGSGVGYAITNAADHTICGHGNIALALSNFGTVLADRNGTGAGPTDLVLRQFDKSNSGSMIASNGGVLNIQGGITINQTTFGLLSAEAGSAVSINTAGIVGGRLSTSGTGVVALNGGGNVLDGLLIQPGSRVVVPCNGTTQVRGSMNIGGTLEIRNDGCGPNVATVEAAPGATLGGGGVIRLLPTAGSTHVTIASLATVQNPVVLSPALTIAGQGTLAGPFNSRATLAPDRAHLPVDQGGGQVGTMVIAPGGGVFDLQGGGVVEFDIASQSSVDTLHSSGPVDLGGLLRARLINGFAPTLGQTFTVMTCQPCTGTFDSVDIPQGFRVVYHPTSVVLDNNPCGPADIGGQGGVPTPDGALDNNDFVVYIDWFFSGDARADVGLQGGIPGADGVFDNNDFIVFIDQFFAACT